MALVIADDRLSEHLQGEADIEVDEQSVWIAPVEVKTKVAPTTLGDSITRTRGEPVFCNVGDEVCHELVAPEHLAQLLQQATVLNEKIFIYMMACEAGLLYTVVVKVSNDIKKTCLDVLFSVSEDVVTWAHQPSGTVPTFVPKEKLDILRIKCEFWKLANAYDTTSGPFRPLKLFKHVTQSFYSKTKGLVDGSTQQRALLRSATSHFRWEQKIVTEVLKTVCINAFFACRIFERRDLLERIEDFNNLESYLNALNKV